MEDRKKTQNSLASEYEELAGLFKQVELAKRQWEQSMDCVEDMVLLVDGQDRIIRCNRAVTAFTGKTYPEILGKIIDDIMLEFGIGSMAIQAIGAEVFDRKKERWFTLDSYPFTSIDDEFPAGKVITIKDITKLKKIASELVLKNEKLHEAYEQLKITQTQVLQQEKMASIGQLAAGVAHEINNPIGFISSNLGTLQKYIERFIKFMSFQEKILATPQALEQVAELRKRLKLDYIIDDIKDLITESLDGADRVKKIVQNLKSFARLDQAEEKMADLNECLTTTLNIVANELKYKATVNKEYGELPLTMCNPQQLNQVFMNLLVNAAQAIEDRGEITIRTWQDCGYIKIAIDDTGAGIPANNLRKIFEPFFTSKDVGKGTGLGLSICYDIVKKHAGKILVESEEGKGTTFTVVLPVQERKD